MYLLQVLATLQGFHLGVKLFDDYPNLSMPALDKGDSGAPLFLTPYIESRQIEQGQKLSRVSLPGFPDLDSYSGFLTVDKRYNSNMFFWYFPPENGCVDAPVLLWLQGGPGSSSLFGLFGENGPVQTCNGTLHKRAVNWATDHHVIYIDNPVGTGFSFTNDSRGYSKDQTQVGDNLYTALVQFFQLFPHLQNNKFYVTGESYAGKYVPAVAYAIHKRNPTAALKINLHGMAIGNGWSDPENQLDYADYLYQHGLIDWNQAAVVESLQEITVSFIRQKQWIQASLAQNLLLNFAVPPEIDIYNYLNMANETKLDDFSIVLQKSEMRRAIHAGCLSFGAGTAEVQNHLRADIMKSVAPWISELLECYELLVYNGQLDIIQAYPLTVNYLRHLKFPGAEEYETAGRQVWWVDGKVAGYVKRAHKLVEVMVRNAGHMVPADQPVWAKDLITKFTSGKLGILN